VRCSSKHFTGLQTGYWIEGDPSASFWFTDLTEDMRVLSITFVDDIAKGNRHDAALSTRSHEHGYEKCGQIVTVT